MRSCSSCLHYPTSRGEPLRQWGPPPVTRRAAPTATGVDPYKVTASGSHYCGSKSLWGRGEQLSFPGEPLSPMSGSNPSKAATRCAPTREGLTNGSLVGPCDCGSRRGHAVACPYRSGSPGMECPCGLRERVWQAASMILRMENDM